jgi:Transposase DDE domain
VPSRHTQFSVDFTTNIAESNFRYTQEAEARARRCAGHALAEDIRFKERSAAERVNSALKDNYGARFVRVRGHDKVLCHLMFGILALAAEQLMRLVT